MDVYIIGCGGNSKVVVDICELSGYNIIGFFDDKYNGHDQLVYHTYYIIGCIDDITTYQNINIINSIGDCTTRNKIYQKLSNFNFNPNWINCIHPQSHIAPTAQIGHGNIICYGAFINSDVVIGNFNLINTYAIIEHDCLVGNFNHIAPKTTLCGSITVGTNNLLGAGTTIIPCKKIGNNNTIGAMSCIVTNINDNCTVVGIPGKIIKNE
jgi:acetyltransferase EpsM